MKRDAWKMSDVPDQAGRIAIITGANTGIGLEVARALAAHGATVVLACRDRARGEHAATLLHLPNPCVVVLNLASLASVHSAAREILSSFRRLDLLINNAGVMAIPFQLSEDGVELTFATNHLGHFALTGLLLERLTATAGSRIVTVSSNAHRRAEPHFEDVSAGKEHDPGAAYDRSKLANLLFTFELQRRLTASGAPTIAVAAHPGNTRTGLWRTSSRLERAVIGPHLRFVTGWLAHNAEEGAVSTLRAALDPTATGGAYYGPGGLFGFTGVPVRVEASARTQDRAAQRRLWELSELLSGVTYPLASPALNERD